MGLFHSHEMLSIEVSSLHNELQAEEEEVGRGAWGVGQPLRARIPATSSAPGDPQALRLVGEPGPGKTRSGHGNPQMSLSRPERTVLSVL